MEVNLMRFAFWLGFTAGAVLGAVATLLAGG
jgi:uncharacterized membrane protein YoaK (UPF0700 family)